MHKKVGKYQQIHKNQLSNIRSIVRKLSKATISQLKAVINDLLLEKKNEYSTKTVLIAIQICEIRQMSYQFAVKCTKSVIE